MSLAETYPPHVAAKAAGTTTKKIRRRLDHRSIELQGCDRKSSGSGDWVGVSRNRILQIAIIESLTKLGIVLSAASAAALKFTDEAQQNRPPGKLFPQGRRTFLVIRSDGPVVLAADYDASFADLSGYQDAMLAIDLKPLVQRVDSILDSTNNLKAT